MQNQNVLFFFKAQHRAKHENFPVLIVENGSSQYL